MADIVDELRDRAKLLDSPSIMAFMAGYSEKCDHGGDIERRAADEIERLRSEVFRFMRRIGLPIRESPPNVWSNDSKLPE